MSNYPRLDKIGLTRAINGIASKVLELVPGVFSRTENGLVPKAPSVSGTSKYLREDGTWNEPAVGDTPIVYCDTPGNEQVKVATSNGLINRYGGKFILRMKYANTYAGELFLKLEGDSGMGSYLYIDGKAASSSSYTLPAGDYECWNTDKIYWDDDPPMALQIYCVALRRKYVFLPSHVGMIIQSTTLNTVEAVREQYGLDTNWIQHEGYILRGATSNVTANDNSNSGTGFGGSDTVTLTGAQSGLKGHGHGFTQPTVNGGATNTGGMSGNNPHSHTARVRLLNGAGNGTYGEGWASSGGAQYNVGGNITNLGGNDPLSVINTNIAHTHSQVAHTHSVSGGAVSDAAASDATSSHSVVQRYKNIYIWERTA